MENNIMNKTIIDLLSTSLPQYEKLDFSKKEDLDKLVKVVNEIKTTNDSMVNFAKIIFGEDSINNILDEVIKIAQQEYAKSHKDDVVIPSNVEENKLLKDTKINNSTRPSKKVSIEMQDKIYKLTNKYIDTIVKPYADEKYLSDEMIKNSRDGLFEFACWIYSR